MKFFNRIRSKLGLCLVFKICVRADGMTVKFRIEARSLEEAYDKAERKFLFGIEDLYRPEELEIWGGA